MLGKNAILLVVGRIAQILLSLVSVRLFTTLLTPAEVGNIYLVNSITGFFCLVLINPVGMYMNRKMFKWGEEQSINNQLFIFNLYLIVVAFVSLGAVFLLHRFLHVANGIDVRILMLFMMLNVFSLTWNQTLIPVLNLFNHRVSFVVLTLLTLSFGLLFSVVAVRQVSPSAIGWLSGQTAAQTLFAVAAFIYFRKVIPGGLRPVSVRGIVKLENITNVLRFVFPLGITTLLMWIQNQSYRMVVENSIGLEFLGMMGLGMGISASIAVAAESLVQQIYYPLFYSEINTSDEEQRTMAWNKMSHLILPFYTSLTIMVSCTAPFLTQILAHRQFGEAAMFVIFGAWIELFRMTTNIFSNVAHAEMKTKYLIKSYMVGGGIAVAGVFLATHFGYYCRITVPLSLLLSGFVTTVIMYMDMKKLIKMKVGIKGIWRSILISVPFFVALPFIFMHHNLLISFVVIIICGIYLVLSQYLIAKPFLKV